MITEERDEKTEERLEKKITDVNQFRKLILFIYWIGRRIQKHNGERANRIRDISVG
jgi:hypothetical protein